MSKYTVDKNYIYYENSDVPKNKLGIRDLKILEAKERELLLLGYEYFHKNLKSSTSFNEKYLKRLHLKTYGSLLNSRENIEQLMFQKGIQHFAKSDFYNKPQKIYSKN